MLSCKLVQMKYRITVLLVWMFFCHLSSAFCFEPTGGCVFSKGSRMLYENCTFDCEPSDLNGNCVYLNCIFYLEDNTLMTDIQGTGVVFLNCRFISDAEGVLYISANAGQTVLVDCSFEGRTDRLEWAPSLPVSLRCYQSGVTLNGREALVSDGVSQTVSMDNHGLLDAYKFVLDGQTYYNVYNLLSGNDGWDPLKMRTVVSAAEEYHGRQFTGLPIAMTLTPLSTTVNGGMLDMIELELTSKLMSGDVKSPQKVFWEMSDNNVLNFAPNTVTDSGCSVFSTSQGSSSVTVTVSAFTEYGLEASSTLLVTP